MAAHCAVEFFCVFLQAKEAGVFVRIGGSAIGAVYDGFFVGCSCPCLEASGVDEMSAAWQFEYHKLSFCDGFKALVARFFLFGGRAQQAEYWYDCRR